MRTPIEKQDIAAAFVTFNPDMDLLQKAILSVKDQVSCVYVIDNGSKNAGAIKNACRAYSIEPILMNENAGIASAFNISFAEAKKAGYTWVLTCDQDSVMPPDLIYSFAQSAINENIGCIGIICPNFFNRTTGVREYEGSIPRYIDKCISSGALTSVKAWDKIAGFDEVMFIDGVDFDFCKRLHNINYRILLVPSICTNHEIGNACIHRILGYKFLVFNHSAFRKYYIAQNIVYFSGKHNRGRVCLKAYFQLAKQYALVLLYENKKKEKLKALIEGASNGFLMCQELRKH
ncbi:glycosyltransferase family 2 protein [Adlercreutzia sp. ZJ304]|uniref:glycosyltransferase family 2 protein n=1 Tax=Adlercreutzia sp. ZJ304 TaxID=2709791 RepID=UPI0013ED8B7E|nr:glycosyltransferase family 2 protein [Adlercreutzia sp. ZJ304]